MVPPMSLSLKLLGLDRGFAWPVLWTCPGPGTWGQPLPEVCTEGPCWPGRSKPLRGSRLSCTVTAAWPRGASMM